MVKNIQIEDTVLRLANDMNANNGAIFLLKRENKNLKQGIKDVCRYDPCEAIYISSDVRERVKRNNKYISTIKKDNRSIKREIKKLQKQMY